MGDAELDSMSDSEYNKLKFQLVRQGVMLRNTTALSPWKQGKCERLIGVFKGALKAHGVGNSSYTDFVNLVAKCEVLVNSRPLGGYHSVWGDIILRPCDLLFPLNANVLVKLSQELPKGGNKEVDHINQTLAIFETFKEQWASMYLHDLRRLNVKRFDLHELR